MRCQSCPARHVGRPAATGMSLCRAQDVNAKTAFEVSGASSTPLLPCPALTLGGELRVLAGQLQRWSTQQWSTQQAHTPRSIRKHADTGSDSGVWVSVLTAEDLCLWYSGTMRTCSNVDAAMVAQHKHATTAQLSVIQAAHRQRRSIYKQRSSSVSEEHLRL